MSIVPKNRDAMCNVGNFLETVPRTTGSQTLFRSGDVVVCLDGKGCVSRVMSIPRNVAWGGAGAGWAAGLRRIVVTPCPLLPAHGSLLWLVVVLSDKSGRHPSPRSALSSTSPHLILHFPVTGAG